jgi:hypothetical protein
VDVQVSPGVLDNADGECAFVGTPAPIVPEEFPIEPCEPLLKIMPRPGNCFLPIEIQRDKPLEIRPTDPFRKCGAATLIGSMPDEGNEFFRDWIIS